MMKRVIVSVAVLGRLSSAAAMKNQGEESRNWPAPVEKEAVSQNDLRQKKKSDHKKGYP